MGHIKVITNKNFDETCTSSTNLIANGMKSMAVRNVLEYTEDRMLSTLIVSGAKSPWQLVDDKLKTKLPIVNPKNAEGISSVAYRFKKMGRIQRASVILSVVGTPGANGDFQLLMKDAILYEGMVCTFADDRFQARVQTNPEGDDANGYNVKFQSIDGTQFVQATHMDIQAGEKTVWGGYSSYEEASLRGYSRSFYPDDFIQHMTTQRKEYALTGEALTDGVVWYIPMKTNGSVDTAAPAGWRFMRERQASIQFMMENEYAKFFGRSSMRLADGTLRAQPSLRSATTGNFITMGDGLEAQIEGENEIIASGADGMPTEDDFNDIITQLVKRSNVVKGKQFYAITGSEGYTHAQTIMATKWANLNAYFTKTYGGDGIGGMEMSVGVDFNTINYGGNSLTFVQHPMMDDEEAWSLRTVDGGMAKSRTYYIVDAGLNSNGKSNIEILAKEAFGINRSMVSVTVNGITGYDSVAVNTVDAITWSMLKEDMLCIYNTTSCGILRPAVA